MTPEERQLLAGLFDRIRAASAHPRDREAEDFITQAAREQPYAPYLLAQTVLVQEQALSAANERLQQLEARVRELESSGSSASSGGSFLGGLGKSIFGSGDSQRPQTSVPSSGASAWGRTSNDAPPAQPGGWGQQPPPQQPYGQPGGPWAQAQPQGGSFLRGALGAAAGVAGGVLLANSIRGLFDHQSNPFGISSGMGGIPGGSGETVVNNYYGSDTDPGRGNPDMSDIFPASGNDGNDPSYDDPNGGFDDDGGDDSSDDTTDV